MAEISIPGDPGGLQALARQLRTAASDVESVQGRVASNGLSGAWSGRASSAFHSTLHELPGELSPIVAAFGDAAQALGTFASRLADLQEQARWCEGQMSNAQQQLRDANARHADAQTKLDAARQAHSTAADPVSLHSAQTAMQRGDGLVRQAQADIEDIGGSIAQLRSRAQGIRNEYEDALRACCSALDSARNAAGRSLSGWIRTHVGGLLGHARHELVAWWRDGTRLVQDVREDVDHVLDGFDRTWDLWRTELESVSDKLTWLGLAVLPVPYVGEVADLVVNAAALEVSIAMSAGDFVEVVRKKRPASDLKGDGVDVLFSLPILYEVRQARKVATTAEKVAKSKPLRQKVLVPIKKELEEVDKELVHKITHLLVDPRVQQHAPVTAPADEPQRRSVDLIPATPVGA